jgi:hypothetical protein
LLAALTALQGLDVKFKNVSFGHSLLLNCFHETCTVHSRKLSDQHSNSNLLPALSQWLLFAPAMDPKPRLAQMAKPTTNQKAN